MTERRPVHLVLAVLLLLVVLSAVADAGNAGPSTERETGASPAAADAGQSATVQPGEKPADRGGLDPGTPAVRPSPASSREPAVATTAAPARATIRAESGAAAGRDSGTARADDEATPRPEATPATMPPAGSIAGTGDNGAGKTVAGAAPTPARMAFPSATLKNGGDDPGEGASDSTAPTVAPTAAATARSTVTACDEAGSTIGTGSEPGSTGIGTARADAEGTSCGSLRERSPAPGSSAAAIGLPDGTAVAPETGRHGRIGVETASVSHSLSGPFDRAARRGPHPSVAPTPGHQYTGRLGGEMGAARPVRADGDDGTRGDHRSRNGEGRRGPPSFPAPAPVAVPARTGLEPPGPGESGGAGRGRKGDLPLAAPMESDDAAPDPILLLRFLLFLGYRRIRPGNVLDHPVRRDLSAAIGADPGLDLAGCVAATGANRETLRYHLCLLVVSGKVVEEARNGSVRYFPHDPALTPVHRAVLHYRRTPSLAPLLNHIRHAPGISRRELAIRLDLAGPTVTRQVQRLIDEGLVEPRRCGRSQRYWLTPPYTEAFAAVEAVGPVQGEAVRAFDRASA